MYAGPYVICTGLGPRTRFSRELLLLALFRLPLSQSDAGATTILVDELDAGGFQSQPYLGPCPAATPRRLEPLVVLSSGSRHRLQSPTALGTRPKKRAQLYRTAMPNCSAGKTKSRRLSVTIPCARPLMCYRPGGRFSRCSSSAAAALSRSPKGPVTIDHNTSGSM